MDTGAFDPDALIRRLRAFPDALAPLARSFTDAEARWKPDQTTWSVLEIVNHLADEDAEDFPQRLRLLLDNPSNDWAPINPEAWARDRNYNQRELPESIERFIAARRASMTWLDAQRAIDWTIAKPHPKFGPMHAGMLLASWCDHDTLHLRQIAKRRHELTLRDAGPFTTLYAGQW